jgi:hypothetical protein
MMEYDQEVKDYVKSLVLKVIHIWTMRCFNINKSDW